MGSRKQLLDILCGKRSPVGAGSGSGVIAGAGAGAGSGSGSGVIAGSGSGSGVIAGVGAGAGVGVIARAGAGSKASLWNKAMELGYRPSLKATNQQLSKLIAKGKNEQIYKFVPKMQDMELSDYDPLTGCNLHYNKYFGSGLKVISMSLFRPLNTVNPGTKYFKGAISYARSAYSILPGWIIRIYYDSSLLKDKSKSWKKLVDLLEKQPNVQLVRYSCISFLQNNNYHTGLFGALIRFAAIIDNNVDVVAFRDIDSDPSHKDYIELENFISSDNDILSYAIYRSAPAWLKCLKRKPMTLIAAGLWVIKRTSLHKPEILWSSMMNILSNNMDIVKNCSPYNNESESESDSDSDSDSDDTIVDDIPFGTDEIILNTIINPHKLGLKHAILPLIRMNLSSKYVTNYTLKHAMELGTILKRYGYEESYKNVDHLPDEVIDSNPLANLIANFSGISGKERYKIINFSQLRGAHKDRVLKYIKDSDLMYSDILYVEEMLPYN